MRRQQTAIAALVLLAVLSQACTPSSIHKFKQNLDKAAVVLNSGAKTNHALYEAGTYGTVGSAGAIETRQKVATAIHDANEWLIKAIEKAKLLKADSTSFEGDKLDILLSLSKAAANLRTERPEIDIVLQSVALIINQAVVIIQSLKSADLKYVLPEIRNWQIARVEV